jgi:predicted RND superfamily exporter protein
MPFMDIDETRMAVDGVNAIVAEANDVYGEDFASKLTGIAAITLVVNDLIIISQFNSLAACIFLTFLTLAIIFRSVKIGLITIIPVICVISLEPGTLVGLDIPLSTITVMIGSIAIGTGVDFSIQIAQRVRLGGYKLKAIFGAVEKAGTSFIEATSTMLIGFAMTLFIPIDSIQEFVIMIMILLTYNAVFALIVLPAIFTVVIRRREIQEARMKGRPPTTKATRRDRYEGVVRTLFRLRDPQGSGPGKQTMLDFEEQPPLK